MLSLTLLSIRKYKNDACWRMITFKEKEIFSSLNILSGKHTIREKGVSEEPGICHWFACPDNETVKRGRLWGSKGMKEKKEGCR